MQKKAEEMKRKCSMASILPIFAFRRKGIRGDAWRVFTMEIDGIKGKGKEIYDALPKLEITKDGNFRMKWENGMKLADFIDMICD